MNEFLTLLLPWQETPNDQISDFFVYIIGGAFFFLGIYFFFRTFFQYRMINDLAEKVPKRRSAQPEDLEKLKTEFPDDEKLCLKKKFSGKRKLNEAWQEFEDSLIPRQLSENRMVVYKTDEASLFFSEDRLLEQHLNLRFWNSVPTLLVGFGILGTFVGLVWGLRSFFGLDLTSNEMEEAIKELLPGVSIAFVTSVWGMLTSLLFNGLEKWRINRVSRAIAKLQRVFDQLFTLTTQEEIAFRQEDELEQQTAALKSFSTDLANDIKSAMENIIPDAHDQNMEDSQEIIQELRKVPDAVSKALEPNLSRLNAIIENLSRTVIESKKDIQVEMEQGRQEIFRELHNLDLSSAQMDTLIEIVDGISKNLIDLPEGMAQITNNIQELSKLTANQTGKQVDQRLTDIGKSFQQSIQTLQDIQQSTHTLLQLQGEQIEAINNQLVNSRATLEKSQEMLKQMNESITSARQTNEENKKYLTANRETMQQFRSTFEQSQRLLGDFAQRFQTIDDGLQSIFAEIQKGLNTYATSTRKSINTYLTDLSKQLESTLKALFGIVEVLSDTVVDLKDKNEDKK